MELLGVPVRWLGHAGFYLDTDPNVVVDPFRARDPRPVDVALITHPHFDHLSVDDLDGFVGPTTTIVTVASAREEIEANWADRPVEIVAPGDTVAVDGLTVEATPAYNVDKNYHPHEEGWVGFVVEVDGTRIYHAGDTDRIPEMEDLDVDAALLPVSGTYVMDAEEAAEAAEILDAEAYVPMHYGSVVGTDRDAERFAARVGDRVHLPEGD